MTLDALHHEWQTDKTLDFSAPDRAITQVPLLHGKWWQLYTHERQRYVSLKQDYDTLKRQKFEWYLGRMDEDERKALGWNPQPVRIVRQEVETYLNTDTDLLPLAGKVDVQELKLKFIEDCIKHINNRGYLIRSYVDYLRFSQGA